jgi:hypothetical protein
VVGKPADAMRTIAAAPIICGLELMRMPTAQ